MEQQKEHNKSPASTMAAPASAEFGKPLSGWRLRCYTVIF